MYGFEEPKKSTDTTPVWEGLGSLAFSRSEFLGNAIERLVVRHIPHGVVMLFLFVLQWRDSSTVGTGFALMGAAFVILSMPGILTCLVITKLSCNPMPYCDLEGGRKTFPRVVYGFLDTIQTTFTFLAYLEASVLFVILWALFNM
jgi:hypothetical protein